MGGPLGAFRRPNPRLTGKFKLSQNRPQHDQARVAAALDVEDHADAAAVAEWMRDYGSAATHE